MRRCVGLKASTLVSILVAMLIALSTNMLFSQEGPRARPSLLPAGKAVLAAALVEEERAKRTASYTSISFPLPICGFAGGLCGAVDRDGTVVVAPAYDWVDNFHEGRALVRSAGRYGYVDETGRLIARPQFDLAGEFSHGFAQVDIGGKSGLIDPEGRIVVAPRFGFVVPFTEDAFWVSDDRRMTDGPPGLEKFNQGPFLTPIINGTRSARDVSPGGKWGLVDRSGAWIRPPEFPSITAFDGAGLMWAKTEAGWGLIRPDGTWQVEPRFEQAASLSQGLAPVALDGRWGYVDATGRIAVEPRFDLASGFYRPLAPARMDKLYGLIDRSGAWVVERKYDLIYVGELLSPGSWWTVKLGAKVGLLDETGHVIVSPQFDQVPSLCTDGGIAGIVDRKPHLFTHDGQPIEPPEGELWWPDTCSAPHVVKVGDRFGYADAALHPITLPKFEQAGGFANGLAVAKIDGKLGLLKPDGTWQIEPSFEALAPTSAGDTALAQVDGKSGLIDVTSHGWIVPPKFDDVCAIPDGLIMAVQDGKRGVMDAKGTWLIEPSFSRLGVLIDDGMVPAQVGGKWAIIDTAGTFVIEPRYDEPTFFRRGINWVKSGASWCPIDRRGQQIPGLQCQASDPFKRQFSGAFECRIR